MIEKQAKKTPMEEGLSGLQKISKKVDGSMESLLEEHMNIPWRQLDAFYSYLGVTGEHYAEVFCTVITELGEDTSAGIINQVTAREMRNGIQTFHGENSHEFVVDAGKQIARMILFKMVKSHVNLRELYEEVSQGKSTFVTGIKKELVSILSRVAPQVLDPFTLIMTDNHIRLKELLSLGMPVNGLDYYNNTPLMCAVRMNNKKMVQLLLEHGADPHEGINGFDSVKLAEFYQFRDIVELFHSDEKGQEHAA